MLRALSKKTCLRIFYVSLAIAAFFVAYVYSSSPPETLGATIALLLVFQVCMTGLIFWPSLLAASIVAAMRRAEKRDLMKTRMIEEEYKQKLK